MPERKMGTLERFLDKPIHPLAPVSCILFVGLGRMLFEIGMYDMKVDTASLFRIFLITAAFYTLTFFLFSVLLRLTLSMPYEKVSKAVCVGLIFGLVPPILDLLFQYEGGWRYIYFRRFTWTLFAQDQPPSESIALWGVILGSGIFTFLARKSVLRAALAAIGGYVIIQVCSGIFLFVHHSPQFGAGKWVNLSWLILSFGCFMALRARYLRGTILRLPHTLPHALLVLCGTAWVGREFHQGLDRMGLVLFLLFVILVQNDHFDAKEDALAGRAGTVTAHELVLSSFLLFLLLIWLLPIYPVLSFLMLLFFVVACLYHHPSIRLKERFCLSYKAEGATALLAFLAGTIEKAGFPKDADLLFPGVLVLGGAAVVSITKDWKDVESDRKAKIPTYYVVLTKSGRSEHFVHRWIVLCSTICLLILPLGMIFANGFHWSFLILLAIGILFGILLLLVRNRERAVRLTMIVLAFFLLFLSLSIKHHRH